MTKSLVKTPEVQALLNKLSGQDQPGGDARVKAIVRRIVGDLFAVIDEFQITDDEFWAAMNFASAGSREFGLWAAGLGVERFLDIRADAVDAEKGVVGGVRPATIEGPLYVVGAPECSGVREGLTMAVTRGTAKCSSCTARSATLRARRWPAPRC